MSKAKSHIIFCDTSLSSQRCVYLNIYENFLLVAMKMQRYLRAWGPKRVQRNQKFIYSELSLLDHSQLHLPYYCDWILPPAAMVNDEAEG